MEPHSRPSKFWRITFTAWLTAMAAICSTSYKVYDEVKHRGTNLDTRLNTVERDIHDIKAALYAAGFRPNRRAAKR